MRSSALGRRASRSNAAAVRTFATARRGGKYSDGWKCTSTRSYPEAISATRRHASPPRNSARSSPSPSCGDSTVTSLPASRSRCTCTAAYAAIPSRLGGNGATIRIRSRVATGLEGLDPDLDGDEHLAGVLLAAGDVEEESVLQRVIDGGDVA